MQVRRRNSWRPSSKCSQCGSASGLCVVLSVEKCVVFCSAVSGCVCVCVSVGVSVCELSLLRRSERAQSCSLPLVFLLCGVARSFGV